MSRTEGEEVVRSEMSALSHPGLIHMLPSLSGKNVKEFFDGLRTTQKLGGWSDMQAIAIGTLKMEGPAKSFFENSLKGREFSNLEEFRKVFVDHFREHKTLAKAIAEFNTAVQKPHEEVKDFASRLEGLVHKTIALKFEGEEMIPVSFQEQMLLSQFLSGLMPTIRAQVMVADPKTFENAKQIARRVEESQKVLTSNINAIDMKSPENHHLDEVTKMLRATTETYAKSMELMTAQLEKMQVQINDLASSRHQPTRPRHEPRCYACGNGGHYARDCRRRRDQGTSGQQHARAPRNSNNQTPN